MKSKLLLFTLLTLCPFLTFCGEKTHTMSFPAMGTFFTITAECPPARAPEIFDAVSREVKRIEKLMSPYIAESDVYRLNNGGKTKLSAETYGIIERAVSLSAESGGAFDISFAPLGALWNYKAENFNPPSRDAVKRVLSLVGYRKIIFYDGNTVGFAKKDMKIGLGGIAKGYAIDRAVLVMKQMGTRSGMANAGGNLGLFGAPPSGFWNIGIRHPREESVICAVKLESGEAVSTSGDYERFVMFNGARYHHIINPLTGYPAEGLISVSVICASAELADAASTAIFVMGINKGAEFLQKRGDLSAVMIDSQLNIYASKRLKERLSFFEALNVNWLP